MELADLGAAPPVPLQATPTVRVLTRPLPALSLIILAPTLGSPGEFLKDPAQRSWDTGPATKLRGAEVSVHSRLLQGRRAWRGRAARPMAAGKQWPGRNRSKNRPFQVTWWPPPPTSSPDSTPAITSSVEGPIVGCCGPASDRLPHAGELCTIQDLNHNSAFAHRGQAEPSRAIGVPGHLCRHPPQRPSREETGCSPVSPHASESSVQPGHALVRLCSLLVLSPALITLSLKPQ